ncbi:hypothetical protein L2E82_02916 [Cichorium intybus]|uniref:Uncharacterized protein n=1 Tax=Cichorium intybus TaxID=13427 RepID=A0ACB9H2Y5_CICIN|nr:hypothetical protein L2E82_02916 [Cichorium intybus]
MKFCVCVRRKSEKGREEETVEEEAIGETMMKMRGFSLYLYPFLKHSPRERVKKRRARLAHTDDCSDDALSITQFHPKLADSEHMTATAIISLPGRRRLDPVAMSPSTDNSGKFWV